MNLSPGKVLEKSWKFVSEKGYEPCKQEVHVNVLGGISPFGCLHYTDISVYIVNSIFMCTMYIIVLDKREFIS